MLASKKEYFEGNSWLIIGLLWGITCFSIMEIIIPWRQKTEIDWNHILIFILPIWLIGGITYGYVMKGFYKKYPEG